MWPEFRSQLDADGDGVVTLEEVSVLVQLRMLMQLQMFLPAQMLLPVLLHDVRMRCPCEF